MALFHKCPMCREFAFVQPELGNKEYKVFRCENGHRFRKPVKQVMKADDKGVWDHMPEWAKTLNDLTKLGK